MRDLTPPTISVVIPAYNQKAEYLREAVRSALTQDVGPLEVIVSDNFSDQQIDELLLRQSDTRLTIVRPPTFLTMNENFGFAARQSSGRYISFLSSDDLLLPGALKALLQALERHNEASFAFGNIYYASALPSVGSRGSSKKLIRAIGEGETVFDPVQARRSLFPWTMKSTWMAGDLIRRDAYFATGGLESCSFRSAGDVWLTDRLLEAGGCVCLDRPVALFRARGVFSREVDRDRRLNDLVDEVTMAGKASSEAGVMVRLRQQATLISRLGAPERPSQEAAMVARHHFLVAGRNDLNLIVEWALRSPLQAAMAGRILRGIEMMRRIRWALSRTLRGAGSP